MEYNYKKQIYFNCKKSLEWWLPPGIPAWITVVQCLVSVIPACITVV